MDLSKLPRWFLVCSLIGLMGLVALGIKFNVQYAFADIAATKTAAFDAKSLSDSNRDSIGELKSSIGEVKTAQETFRKEYREDQKDLYRAMKSMKDEILSAVKG